MIDIESDSDQQLRNAALLIVDDDQRIRSSLKRFFRDYERRVLEASSAEKAKEILENENVGVLLADHKMAGMNGLDLLRWAREHHPRIVRVMLTGHSSVKLMREVINSGEVFRFITKPWVNEELMEVIGKSFEQYEKIALQRRLEKYQGEREKTLASLEQRLDGAMKSVLEYKESLKESRVQAVQALARAVDAKDPYTNGHMERVGQVALEIADALDLPSDQKDTIHMAGLLHDVGKIGVPDSILLCPNKLAETDWEIMKLHPEMGGNILKPIKFSWNVKELVEAHHERIDGKGYPRGLKGDEIPLGARILGVADAYDAMANKRRYRPGMPKNKIIRIITENLGTQFDQEVGRAAIHLIEQDKLGPQNSGDLSSCEETENAG